MYYEIKTICYLRKITVKFMQKTILNKFILSSISWCEKLSLLLLNFKKQSMCEIKFLKLYCAKLVYNIAISIHVMRMCINLHILGQAIGLYFTSFQRNDITSPIFVVYRQDNCSHILHRKHWTKLQSMWKASNCSF